MSSIMNYSALSLRTIAFLVVSLGALLSTTSCGGSGIAFGSIQTAFTFSGGKHGTIQEPGFWAVEATRFKIIGPNNLLVTSLGVENALPTQETKPVAIYDGGTNNIIATATISNLDTLSNGYYWVDITPVTLVAGKEYYIGALHTAGPNASYLRDTGWAHMLPQVQDLDTYFRASSTITVNGWQVGGGNIRHYVANFKAAPITP